MACLLQAGAQVRHYTASDGLSSGTVWQIVELPNGQLLTAGDGVFQLFNGKNFVPVPCSMSRCMRLPSFGIGYSHRWQGDSLLWLRDFYNVYLFDVRRRAFRYDYRGHTGSMKSFVNGKVGQETAPGADCVRLIKSHGITGQPTVACRDRQGGWWIGVQEQGIYYFAPHRYTATTYPTPNGKTVMAVAECTDGIVVCTEDGILLFDKSHHYKYLRKEQGALYHNAMTDNHGRVWMSSQRGLLCYDHGKMNLYDGKNVKGFLHSQVRFARVVGNKLLVANLLHYLGYLNPETHLFYPLNGKLPQLENYRTMVDACVLPDKRHVAVLTQNGMTCLDISKNKLSNFVHLPSGISQKVNCALVDSHKRLWIGTQNGLVQGNDKWFGGCIKGLAEDHNGRIWASTAMGVACFSKQKDAMTVMNYNAWDGIPEDGLAERGILTTKEGTITLAGTHGLTLFAPSRMITQTTTLPVVLVGLTVNGRERLSDAMPLQVNYNDNYFSFNLSALNYASPQRTVYRYRLQGFDTSWLKADGANGMITATYNALPPGHYMLQAQASVDGGKWGPTTQWSFTVLPPWWLTWWAKALYALVALCALCLAITAYVRKKQHKLEHDNEERVNQLFELREQARHQFAQSVNIQPEKISVNKEEEELVERLLKAIGQHIDDADYTVDQLAADVFVSRTGLYRKMQSMLGITPNDFLRNVRLKKAAQLLAETNVPLGQIATMVGFRTPRYFSKCFKDMFGVTPAEYRQPKVENE